MSIKWAPPSPEELAARGVPPARARESDGTVDLGGPSPEAVSDARAAAPAAKRRKGGGKKW
jgi:hypothetical protein